MTAVPYLALHNYGKVNQLLKLGLEPAARLLYSARCEQAFYTPSEKHLATQTETQASEIRKQVSLYVA